MEPLAQRNLHDCYFFYYSTCRKGSSCTFRHEPNALGHEVAACQNFLEGNCLNPKCELRHMKIQKPRSDTVCYFESQPQGCCKAHCVFAHRLPRTSPASIVNQTIVDPALQNQMQQQTPLQQTLILLPPHAQRIL